MRVDRRSQISAELRLLLELTRFSAPSIRAAETDASWAGVDWERFLALAGRHGLLPIISRSSDSIVLPSHVRERLATFNVGNAARNLRHAAELIRIIASLQSRGIRVMPLKGPVLAQEVYGDLTARQFTDLDILVRSSDLAAAEAVLADRGYQRPPVPNAEGYQKPLRARHHLELRHPQRLVLVELHWRLTNARDDFRLTTEEVFARACHVAFLGQEVLSLNPEDLFVYLAHHAAHQGWISLEQLRALAAIVTGHPDIDWAAIPDRAARYGVRRRVLVSALLLNHLGVGLPAALLEAAEEDTVARHLAAEARSTWEQETSPLTGELKEALLQMDGMDGWRGRITYLFSLVFTPTQLDWEAVKLPGPLYPAYHLVRPARLLGVYGRRAGKRLLGRS